jgi:CDP-diacylglycerol--glycerol-3-phosphate 3-phosphatidyltransferase
MKEKLRELTRDMWNVPNVLTILRLVLVPVFIVLYMNGQRIAALVVFALASLTDMLDGRIARKYNLITNFGKLMDPLADKLMVLTALFCQGSAGVLPWTAIFIVLAKELWMMCGSVFMLKKGIVVYANYFGKTATVCFILSLILSFFHEELAAWGYRVDLWLLWTSVALALLALTVYTVQAWKQLYRTDGQNSNPPGKIH